MANIRTRNGGQPVETNPESGRPEEHHQLRPAAGALIVIKRRHARVPAGAPRWFGSDRAIRSD